MQGEIYMRNVGLETFLYVPDVRVDNGLYDICVQARRDALDMEGIEVRVSSDNYTGGSGNIAAIKAAKKKKPRGLLYVKNVDVSDEVIKFLQALAYTKLHSVSAAEQITRMITRS